MISYVLCSYIIAACASDVATTNFVSYFLVGDAYSVCTVDVSSIITIQCA